MELGPSQGSEASKPFLLMGKPREIIRREGSLGFRMCTSISPNNSRDKKREEPQEEEEEEEEEVEEVQGEERVNNTKEIHSQDQTTYSTEHESKKASDFIVKEMDHKKSSPVQLDLFPNTPVLTTHLHNSLFSCPFLDGNSGLECSIKLADIGIGLDVKRVPPKVVVDLDLTDQHHRREKAVAANQDVSSSPQNSGSSSFQMDFSLFNKKFGGNINESDHDNSHRQRRASSRASDDENGCSRKKLRLSKEQSAFLEESFKEHSTLNPKRKLALAKQLNLRPRQVEVWFQNRRARTKLKQTEVDCEYLKRCCETLTEENKRLHKELQGLRALKTSNPFYMQLPATTLTMCPSCEKIATTTTITNTNTKNNNNNIVSDPISKTTELQLVRPKFYPFSSP